MADEPVASAAPIAPAAAPSQGPASAATPQAAAPAPSETVVAAPAASSQAAPPVATEPVAAVETPAAEVKPAEPAKPAEAPKEPASILSDAKTTAEPPKAEEKPAAEPISEAAPLPKFEAFTLPEGLTRDDEQMGKFSNLLGQFEVESKLPHELVQKHGQQLVDFYIEQQKQAGERMVQLQRDNWERMQDSWRTEFRDAPDIGKNRQDTTIRQCGALMERYGQMMGADKEASLRMAWRVTGAGNHPDVIRFLNWASQFAVERARPVAAIVPKQPVVKSRATRRYAGSSTTGNGAA